MRALAIACFLIIGCGASAPPAAEHTTETERYRHILMENVDPNGLAWDPSRRLLYVADDDRAQVMVIVNGVVLAGRPLQGAGGGAGGLTQLGDGSIACARFGTDGDGGIVRLLSDEAVRAVPGLDPSRHRLGVAAWGDLYVAWFSGPHDAWTGGVARVDIATGAETQVLGDLGKAVGVAILDDLLVASDQTHDSLFACHLPDCTDRSLLAMIPTPDLMTASADEVFVSSRDGNVYGVRADGSTRTVASEVGGQPRGLAWDSEDRELFVAIHDPSPHPRHLIAIVEVPALPAADAGVSE
jgi:hypothetical protein